MEHVADYITIKSVSNAPLRETCREGGRSVKEYVDSRHNGETMGKLAVDWVDGWARWRSEAKSNPGRGKILAGP